MIWGVGSPLHEQAVIDRRHCRLGGMPGALAAAPTSAYIGIQPSEVTMSISNPQRRQLSLLVALTAAAVLPACGGGGDSGTPSMAAVPATAPAPAPAPVPAPAPAPTPAPTPAPGPIY
jgi:hypothetical protein